MSEPNSPIDSENTSTAGRIAQQSLWVRVGAWMLSRHVAWIVLLVTLLVTFLVWKGAEEALVQAQQVQFENRAAEVVTAIHKRMQGYEQVLRGGVGLFAASNSVERDEWRDYVASMRVQEQYPGIQGISFAVHIPAARLDAHLRMIRAEGFPDYTIRPAGVRAEYTPVVYIEPFDGSNQRALGFDIFSEATRRAALERARDTGSPAISAKVTLVQETAKEVQPGILMVMPVYKNGAPRNTLAERRANLLGYVSSPFRLNDLMSGILENKRAGAQPDIDIEIYDGTLRSADSLLYDDDGIAHALGTPPPGSLTLTRSIDLYGHTWSSYFTTRPAFHAAFDNNKPLLFLVVGTLLSVMLAGLVWMFATQRQSALALVSHMITENTERKHAEAAHASLEAQLRESQKMESMGTLAGGIAHDFNNIIATIMGNTMLAKNDVRARPEDVLVSLEEIDKAAKRAKNLVQQILTFSRKGGQTFVVQPVRQLVEEAMRLMRSTIPPGVEFAAKFAETPLYACVDSTQIEQVLINLCTNACHAMKDNAGRIEIEMAEVLLDQTAAQLSPNLHPGQYVRLSVSDNGSGMDEATQAHIFEPFFTTKGVGLGTGLGLSVVHGIVKSHQGAITVESAPGKGTMFRVYLPAVAASTEAGRGADAAPTLSAGQGNPGKRVLYVDDDEALVGLVLRVLKQLGYSASGYMAGPDAVEAVRADPHGFDLVVSDYNMPGMSGLDVAKEVRSIRPDLPVAIFSGYVTEELRANALQVGAREVINKANTVDQMCQSIQQLLSVQTGRG